VRGNFSFVNNHFWNCYEVVSPQTGHASVVVDTVAATPDYLDIYFEHSLDVAAPQWSELFYTPSRCIVPGDALPAGDDVVACVPLLRASERDAAGGAAGDEATAHLEYFDYPTFNPSRKMNASYRWTWAIAPLSASPCLRCAHARLRARCFAAAAAPYVLHPLSSAPLTQSRYRSTLLFPPPPAPPAYPPRRHRHLAVV
jgi:hypothetical protein